MRWHFIMRGRISVAILLYHFLKSVLVSVRNKFCILSFRNHIFILLEKNLPFISYSPKKWLQSIGNHSWGCYQQGENLHFISFDFLFSLFICVFFFYKILNSKKRLLFGVVGSLNWIDKAFGWERPGAAVAPH